MGILDSGDAFSSPRLPVATPTRGRASARATISGTATPTSMRGSRLTPRWATSRTGADTTTMLSRWRCATCSGTTWISMLPVMCTAKAPVPPRSIRPFWDGRMTDIRFMGLMGIRTRPIRPVGCGGWCRGLSCVMEAAARITWSRTGDALCRPGQRANSSARTRWRRMSLGLTSAASTRSAITLEDYAYLGDLGKTQGKDFTWTNLMAATALHPSFRRAPTPISQPLMPRARLCIPTSWADVFMETP